MVSLAALLLSGTETTAGKVLLGLALICAVFVLIVCENLDIVVQLDNIVIVNTSPNIHILPFCISGKISQEL
jgi:hypothetical protein